MDYRNILALAAVIFAAGYFVRSFQPAYAFPQGPNVSIGSNPIENFYGNANQTGSLTFQDNFILTTLISSTDSCAPKIDGTAFHTGSGSINMFYYRYAYFHPSPFSAGTAKLHIPSGSVLSLNNCSNYYIEGYYTH